MKRLPTPVPLRTKALTDKEGRIFGGIFTNTLPSWPEKVVDASAFLADLQTKLTPAAKHADHRRGQFGYLSTGISHGNGSEASVMYSCDA